MNSCAQETGSICIGRIFRSFFPILAVLIPLGAALSGCSGDEQRNDSAGEPPSAPKQVSASPGEGEVTLSWNLVSGADSYNTYWATTKGVSKDTGNRIVNAVSPFTHAGLTGNTTYFYVVTAVNTNGESDESAEVGGSVGTTPEGAPTQVAASSGDGQVTLSWDLVSGATSYNLYWATTPGVDKATGNRITGATSPYTHSGLTNNVTYYYIVTAVSASGESAESLQVFATAVPASGGGDTTPPASVTGFTATTGNAQVTLAWTNPADSDFTGVLIRRSTTVFPATASDGVSVFDGAPTSFVDTGLVNGTTYLYTAFAHDGAPNYASGIQAGVAPAVPNTWATKTSMLAGRNLHSGEVVNGKLYVLGGNDGSLLDTVEEYDPATDTWSTASPITLIRWAAASAVVNGKIYVFGGFVADDSVEEYDPATDSWTTKTAMPTGRQTPTASVVNGKIYVIGGKVGTAEGDWVEEYDPVNDSWATKTSLPVARSDLMSSVVNGKIYVIGGRDDTDVLSAVVEEYDPVNDSWATKSPITIVRGLSVSNAVNGKIYVFGGFDGVYIADVEEYDPGTDTWTTVTMMPIPRSRLASGVIGGKIYIAGGISDNAGFSAVVEEYAPPAP